VIVPILCICGLAGNVLILKILKHHKLNPSTNILLFAMTASDAMLTATDTLCQGIVIVQDFHPVIAIVMAFFYRYFIFRWNHRAYYFSLCTLALIALERLALLSSPVLASRMFTDYNMKWSLAVLVTLTFIFTFPSLYLLDDFTVVDGKFLRTNSIFITEHRNVAVYLVGIGDHAILYMPLAILLVSTAIVNMLLFRRMEDKHSSSHD
ncbi:unnamed protein product, partial [Lymnaea stagnalis]